ncbi:MAG: twin transmembrane helix small protein [Alphaproteobacteria bacterium]|nr:twin transmembrane helix small protein [Alphaproteobacteria bacterium]
MLNNFVFYSLIIVMFATLIALFLGIFTMIKGGEVSKKYGNFFMRWRVGLQGLAIVLFILLILFNMNTH